MLNRQGAKYQAEMRDKQFFRQMKDELWEDHKRAKRSKSEMAILERKEELKDVS